MSDAARRGAMARARVRLPLLDRLMADGPDRARSGDTADADGMEALQESVRRDLQWLLNTRRRWRSLPPAFAGLEVSPLGYGLSDIAGGDMQDPARREALRREVEDTIRRFEPRFVTLRVALSPEEDRPLSGTLDLRIEALLRAEPAPEPVRFITLVDPATDEVTVRQTDDFA